MFFLLRSAFWLGLVFSQMTWPLDGLAPALPATVHVSANAAARACSARPRDCLALASALARVP
jgi:hypothetical protein